MKRRLPPRRPSWLLLFWLPLCALLLPGLARALTHAELMMLQPQPNVKQHGVGIYVYNGMNAMDFLGPMQVFGAAGLKPFLIAKDTRQPVVTSNGLSINVSRSIAEVSQLDILVVPGGTLETAAQTRDEDLLDWIRRIDRTTVYTTSVCTGAWILGAAGLLKGKQATSNWYRAAEILTKFRAIPRPGQRYVFDGKLVTSAGVTAGIDMALAIVKQLYAHDGHGGRDYTQAVMLELQYDPHPPVRGGSPAKTNRFVRGAMQEMYDMFLYNPDVPGYDWALRLAPLP